MLADHARGQRGQLCLAWGFVASMVAMGWHVGRLLLVMLLLMMMVLLHCLMLRPLLTLGCSAWPDMMMMCLLVVVVVVVLLMMMIMMWDRPSRSIGDAILRRCGLYSRPVYCWLLVMYRPLYGSIWLRYRWWLRYSWARP
jgi:hypothetical protein